VLSTWAPLPSWRFGVGARTGEGRTDEHRLDRVSVRAGAAVAPGSVELEISSNGHQFSSSGVHFAYSPLPVVSSSFPAHGPTSGATQVLISGSNLDGGTHYKCRFGGLTVSATFDPASAGVRCASALHGVGTAMLEVSLNAQQYGSSSVNFTYV